MSHVHYLLCWSPPTQVVINSGALPALLALMMTNKRGIKREATWTVSNIMAGNKDQIQAVIDCNIVQMLVDHLTRGEWEVIILILVVKRIIFCYGWGAHTVEVCTFIPGFLSHTKLKSVLSSLASFYTHTHTHTHITTGAKGGGVGAVKRDQRWDT